MFHVQNAGIEFYWWTKKTFNSIPHKNMVAQRHSPEINFRFIEFEFEIPISNMNKRFRRRTHKFMFYFTKYSMVRFSLPNNSKYYIIDWMLWSIARKYSSESLCFFIHLLSFYASIVRLIWWHLKSQQINEIQWIFLQQKPKYQL